MNRSLRFRWIIGCLFLGFLALFSCKKKVIETVPAEQFYYSYYPLNTGNWYIYQIDSIKYSAARQRWDTTHNQMRIMVDTPFKDNSGEQAYKLFRSYRATDLDEWSSPRVFYTKKTRGRVEFIEENVRYVKLEFPVKKDKSWNGNGLNNIDSFKQYDYHITEAHQSFKLNKVNYDSTAYVQQIDYIDFLDHKYAGERYAAKVGLIFREMIDTGWTGLKHRDAGYFYKQSLLKYSVQ